VKRTRKFLIVAAVLVALAVASMGIAYAITNGEPDAGRHPYVALLVFGEETDDGFVPYWRCSGSLIVTEKWAIHARVMRRARHSPTRNIVARKILTGVGTGFPLSPIEM